MAVKPIPDSHSSVIPYLVVPDAAGQIEFLQRVFDAVVMHQTIVGNGIVMHAHLRIGGSSIMIGQGRGGHPTQPAMLYTYVPDAHATYRRAIEAGAAAATEVADQFYGDRAGSVKDPAGNEWWIATHIEDVSDAELSRRAAAFGKQG